MSNHDASRIADVEETLGLLADELRDEDRGDFDRDMTLVRILIQPSEVFTVEGFVLGEVARAMLD